MKAHNIYPKNSSDPKKLLTLDKELAEELDKVKVRWIKEVLGHGVDPDKYIVPRLYDSIEMKMINDVSIKNMKTCGKFNFPFHLDL